MEKIMASKQTDTNKSKKCKRWWRYLRNGVLLFLALPLLYLASAWGLGSITVHNQALPAHNASGNVVVYLLSNGVHTDIVMPMRNHITDWRKMVSVSEGVQDKPQPYVAIGWGERNFYLNTPTWRDLTAATAAKAISGINTTLLRVTFYPAAALKPADNIVRFQISAAQYRKLSQHIQAAFILDANGRGQVLANPHHGKNNQFYLAHGRYHLFYTCNTWVNQQLKQSQLPAVVWTPFTTPLLSTYRTLASNVP